MSARSIGRVSIDFETRNLGSIDAKECSDLSEIFAMVRSLVDVETGVDIFGPDKYNSNNTCAILLGGNNRMIDVFDIPSSLDRLMRTSVKSSPVHRWISGGVEKKANDIPYSAVESIRLYPRPTDKADITNLFNIHREIVWKQGKFSKTRDQHLRQQIQGERDTYFHLFQQFISKHHSPHRSPHHSPHRSPTPHAIDIDSIPVIDSSKFGLDLVSPSKSPERKPLSKLTPIPVSPAGVINVPTFTGTPLREKALSASTVSPPRLKISPSSGVGSPETTNIIELTQHLLDIPTVPISNTVPHQSVLPPVTHQETVTLQQPLSNSSINAVSALSLMTRSDLSTSVVASTQKDPVNISLSTLSQLPVSGVNTDTPPSSLSLSSTPVKEHGSKLTIPSVQELSIIPIMNLPQVPINNSDSGYPSDSDLSIVERSAELGGEDSQSPQSTTFDMSSLLMPFNGTL